MNPRSLRTMSASDDFDNLAENATCLINSIETTGSMVKFITLKWCSLSNCNWCVSLDAVEIITLTNLLELS